MQDLNFREIQYNTPHLEAKEYTIIEEQPLLNGYFNAATREITNLEAEYKQT